MVTQEQGVEAAQGKEEGESKAEGEESKTQGEESKAQEEESKTQGEELQTRQDLPPPPQGVQCSEPPPPQVHHTPGPSHSSHAHTPSTSNPPEGFPNPGAQNDPEATAPIEAHRNGSSTRLVANGLLLKSEDLPGEQLKETLDERVSTEDKVNSLNQKMHILRQ